MLAGMNRQVPIIVAARMSSVRLPGKSLRQLADDTVLGYVLRSVGHAKKAGGIVVATSTDPSDDILADWCTSRGQEYVRGPLDDVASRLLSAAEALGADAFVRVSGDSPLLDPAIVDFAIERWRVTRCDLVSNIHPRTFPRGQSVEVLSTALLSQRLENSTSGQHRQHVTSEIYLEPGEAQIDSFTAVECSGAAARGLDASRVHMAVDTVEDLDRCRAIVTLLGAEAPWSAGWLACFRAGETLARDTPRGPNEPK